ncbi:MAG: hypothetical protein IKX74_00280 [Erysipelotrichaceae bacterium]|nr:hypothetical protein [Erysipelotrichaceae bacterium]MBR5048083.1 hypothetical protein [Erysipelotrichaceae bacterium]
MDTEQKKEIEEIAERYVVRPYAFYWDSKIKTQEDFQKSLASVAKHCHALAMLIATGLYQNIISEKEAEDIFYAFAESVREKRSMLYWLDNYDSDTSSLVSEILLPEYDQEIECFRRISGLTI